MVLIIIMITFVAFAPLFNYYDTSRREFLRSSWVVIKNYLTISLSLSFYRYCVEFEVIKATKACYKDPIYKQLTEGERVVVKCDLEAFLPHDDKEENVNSENEVYGHHHKGGDNAKNLENETVEDGFKSQASGKVSKTKNNNRFRCRGEGSTGRNTRFNAMAIPSCHGKWMRLTVGQPKKCSYHDSQFIFV
jgi:hypothetical protein